MFQTAGSFVSFSLFFAKCFTVPAKRSPGEILQGINFLLDDVPLDILALTGLVLGIQRKEGSNFDLPIPLPHLLWL